MLFVLTNMIQPGPGSDIKKLVMSHPTTIATWQLVRLVERLTNSGHLDILNMGEKTVLVNGYPAENQEDVANIVYKLTRVESLLIETTLNRYTLSWVTEKLNIKQLCLEVCI